MEKDKRLYVFIVVGVLAVLLGTCFGAFLGGVVGYCVGRRVTTAEGRLLPQLPEWKRPTVEPGEPELAPPEALGALVTKVVDGGPADQAGIQPGDLIVAVDGVRIGAENPLERIIHQHRPGDRVEITLWSKGRERTVRVKLGKHPEEEGVAYLGVYYVLARQTERPKGND